LVTKGGKRTFAAIEKMITLDTNNYDAHYALANVHIHVGEQELALARLKRSLELNPNASNVMAAVASPLFYTRKAEEAIKVLHQAMRLDPHHPGWFKWTLGWAQWSVGDCDAALSSILSMAKIPTVANRTLAIIYVCLGRQKDAEAAITKLLEKNQIPHSLRSERKYKIATQTRSRWNVRLTLYEPQAYQNEMNNTSGYSFMNCIALLNIRSE
jgi:tetratricopeptide (TPR) repeat protein